MPWKALEFRICESERSLVRIPETRNGRTCCLKEANYTLYMSGQCCCLSDSCLKELLKIHIKLGANWKSRTLRNFINIYPNACNARGPSSLENGKL